MRMELAVSTGSRVGTVVRNGTINGKELVEPSFAGGASGIVPDLCDGVQFSYVRAQVRWKFRSSNLGNLTCNCVKNVVPITGLCSDRPTDDARRTR